MLAMLVSTFTDYRRDWLFYSQVCALPLSTPFSSIWTSSRSGHCSRVHAWFAGHMNSNTCRVLFLICHLNLTWPASWPTEYMSPVIQKRNEVFKLGKYCLFLSSPRLLLKINVCTSHSVFLLLLRRHLCLFVILKLWAYTSDLTKNFTFEN